MGGYSKRCLFLSACALQCLPLLLHAQFPNSGYAPLVPNTVGASVAPVVPIEQPEAPPAPVQTTPVPPPTIAPPSPPVIENQLPSFTPKAPLAPERALEILDFWFGNLPNPGFFPRDKVPIWLASTPDIERQIRENFSQDVLDAMRGDYNSWRETPRGRLALILLLDQFTRIIYRNKPQAFMADRMARALALEGIQKGDDKSLFPVERAFFYLPLEHAEDLQLQNLSVAYYRQLLADSPPSIQPQMQAFLQYAILHQQQIARFGRFPYRNAILGRESTPEEVVFLTQWGRPSF